MKGIIFILAVTLLSSCTSSHKMNIVRKSVDTGQIQGMDKETKFSYTFGIPGGATHPGPYSLVDLVNVKVETWKYTGKKATFFLGKSRETGQWEIFNVMLEEDGKWRMIPLPSNGKK